MKKHYSKMRQKKTLIKRAENAITDKGGKVEAKYFNIVETVKAT
jgi:hypothetical protein